MSLESVDFLILSDPDGGECRLTNQVSASSYGISVLCISGDDVSGTFGPADVIGEVSGIQLLASHLVISWARDAGRTTEEKQAARLFLSQWPEGPQI